MVPIKVSLSLQIRNHKGIMNHYESPVCMVCELDPEGRFLTASTEPYPIVPYYPFFD
jgi:hypothetical protein